MLGLLVFLYVTQHACYPKYRLVKKHIKRRKCLSKCLNANINYLVIKEKQVRRDFFHVNSTQIPRKGTEKSPDRVGGSRRPEMARQREKTIVLQRTAASPPFLRLSRTPSAWLRPNENRSSCSDQQGTPLLRTSYYYCAQLYPAGKNRLPARQAQA